MQPDESFREFVDARGAMLSRAAYLLAGEQTVARDLLRGALAKALKQWDRLRDGGDPDDFVRQAMLSATWLWWRQPRRPGEFATAVLPDHPVEDAEAPDVLPNAVLAAILPRLRRRQRVVMYLRFGEDVPVPEIARLVNSNSDRVAKHLRTAMQRCRQLAPGVLRVPDHDEPDSWDEYHRFADSITTFAAADDAMVAIGRNRRVGATIAAVPLALILVVAASALLDGGLPRSDDDSGDWRAFGPVRQLPSPDPTPLVPIDVWRRPDNEPVPTGTLIEGDRSGCGYYEGCHLYLRTREGVRISVESLLPALSRRWSPIGLNGSTWSPNGEWFGLARSQTYEFHNFANGDMVRLPTGPSQSFWEPVGWAADSSAAFLIRIEDDRLAEYFVFDAERGGYKSYRPDRHVTLRPVGVGRDGSFLVAEPVDVGKAPTGTFKVWSLDVEGYSSGEAANRVIGPPFTIDVRKHLREGETIVGPSRVPKIIRPVLGDNARAWVTVFKEERHVLEPVAMLHLANDDTQTARIELPRDRAGEGRWRLLGALGSGIAMLYEPQAGDSEVVLFSGLGRQSVQYVPDSSEVLLPGMSY